ncbi:Mps1 family protein kinase [Emydomyces testavorans]|uniref:Mps1 family protein kinase n=1 Tax=Emydomyces testavorans TaxID=2070801 RepID=A0AAF0DKM5_9EURO|nr:Mps1 family protein kinase [Emydomyces testavorans]
MALHGSPTPFPSAQRSASYNPRPASIHDLHRRTVSRQIAHDGSPNGVFAESGNRVLGGMARSRTFSAMGDSSDDDDFPEPIKFSASVKALLGEDASGLDTSPRRGNRDGLQDGEKYRRNVGPLREKQVRIASPSLSPARGEHGGRSPSLRIVRVVAGAERRRSSKSLGRENSFVSGREESGDGVLEGNREDFITPALRTRSVRIVTASRSTTRSPSALIPSANGGTSSDASRIEERSLLEDGARRGLDEKSYVRAGMGTLPRTRGDVETGVHGSLRVKRVGKLSGSFLNGPARRGVLRRQSDEEPRVEHNEESLLDTGSHNRHEEAQEQASQMGDSLVRNYPRFERRQESPQLSDSNGAVPSTKSSQSPQSLPIRERSLRRSGSARALKNGSPLSSHQFKSTTGSGGGGSPRSNANVRPVSLVPPPPELPSKHDQENDPPSTFKRAKPFGYGLLDKVDKVSVLYDDDKDADKPAPETMSPRKPLGKMSNNTPHRAAPAPPPKMGALETVAAVSGTATSQSKRKRAQISINRKGYTRLGCIGRGGSARVYRVMAEDCKIYALKRVNLENVDSLALAGYKGEIDLLKRLQNVERVVRLHDWEINEEKHALSLLMEIGESDLDRLIKRKLNIENAAFDPVFTRFYWKEMLECVQAVHDYDIVHSDLKPANFLLVDGKLKLIDFGIANTIQDHTVNVHREQQVGTPNFMAPEALIDCNAALGLPATAGRMMKLGKPSDVWSLGCILYRMVYGRPPFGHLAKPLECIMAIPNPKVAINFPSVGVGNVPVPPALVRTLKGCLQRDQTLRPTIRQLLSHNDPFLYPETHLEGTVPITQEMLGRILSNVVNHCRSRGPPTEEELAGWPAGFFARIKAALEDEQ